MTAEDRKLFHAFADQQTDILVELGKVQTKLKGNGGQGILPRLDQVERWVKSRPQKCPANPTRGERISGKRLVVAILALLLLLVSTGLAFYAAFGG